MAKIEIKIRTIAPTNEWETVFEQNLNNWTMKVSDEIDKMTNGDAIADASGTLANLVTQFNTLLSQLRTQGILKT